MYARVATFEMDNVDDLVDDVRRDVEENKRPPGLEDAKGVMFLVDRDKGKTIGITFYDSEDALKKGDEVLNQMSPGGSTRRTSVEFYEVPIQRMS